jgi:hypothetical protein
MFGRGLKEVAGGWRKLHNKELHNLYSFVPNILRAIESRKMKWAWHVARKAEMRNAYKILVVKCGRKSTW